MPHISRASFFLHLNYLIWVVIVIGSFLIYETFKTGFDEILENIQAQLVSYKKTWITGFLGMALLRNFDGRVTLNGHVFQFLDV